MESRQVLLKHLVKIKKIYSKDTSKHHKVSLALKKIIEDHIAVTQGDEVLRDLLIQSKHPAEFCEGIIRQLSNDITTVVLRVDSPTSGLKNGKSSKLKKKRGPCRDVISAIRKEVASKKSSLNHETWEEMPSEDEIASHYRSIASHTLSLPTPFDNVDKLLDAMERQEPVPLVIPLAIKVKDLWEEDLLKFLPIHVLVDWLRDWDGRDVSLHMWKQAHRLTALQDALKRHDQSMIQAMLDHLTVRYKCGRFQKLQTQHLWQLVDRSLQFPTTSLVSLLHGINLHRKCIPVDLWKRKHHTYHYRFPPFFFKILEWLPGAVSVTIHPTPPSMKSFVHDYFHVETITKGQQCFLKGTTVYTLRYKMSNGMMVLHDEFLHQQQLAFFQEGRMKMSSFLHYGGHVFVELCRQWIMDSLQFLDKNEYNLQEMSDRIISPILQQATTVAEFQETIHHVLGRLHPSFKLCRYHRVLKERLHHFYFHLEMLYKTPLSLVFPEYYACSESFRHVLDTEWKASKEEFCRLMWHKKLPCESIKKTTYFFPVLDKSVHIDNDGQSHPLNHDTSTAFSLSPFIHEDFVPHGKEALGVFTEAPSYYHPVTIVTNTLFHQCLDEIFKDGLVLTEDAIDDDEGELRDQETDMNSMKGDEEEEDDVMTEFDEDEDHKDRVE